METTRASAGRHRSITRWAAISAVALAGLGGALVQPNLEGHWQGLFLLRGKSGRRLELRDDLYLGDGQRIVAGFSFSRLRRALSGNVSARPGEPWLELEWDEATGDGLVTNHLADGTELVTNFSRFVDEAGRDAVGLFVGGALPDVAESNEQNQSGMSFHDARGWHHVWCNVNEALADLARDGRMSYPGEWTFLGSRVLIHDPARVVLESSHELRVGASTMRMDRFAHFRAGQSWFKLGIRLVNIGDTPISYSYAYGDEPWVGTFGSAEGNVGWVEGSIVPRAAFLDMTRNRWAGILDEKSGIANFISWIGEDLPSDVYFSNRPGLSPREVGELLTSNEVFIGLEWRRRVLNPGESRSMLLSIGLAEVDAKGVPHLPSGAGPQ